MPQFLRLAPLVLVAAATSSAAFGANATIEVRDSAGRPMPHSVVMIDTQRKSTGKIAFPWPYVMAQQKVAFTPQVLIVPVGASVPFPNRDRVRHHVYSFSTPKKFDLKLYGKDETRSVVFDKPGVVAVGCNIHDAMNGFVIVVDTPYVMLTDANGRVTIPNVPAGGATMRVWNPAIRAPGNMLSQAVTVPAAGLTLTYTVRGK